MNRTRFTFVAVSCLSGFFIGAVSIANAQSGIASVYSGGRTANGEVASASGMTAAHKTLPFGTLVRVTHQHSGQSVVVRINDRGPFVLLLPRLPCRWQPPLRRGLHLLVGTDEPKSTTRPLLAKADMTTADVQMTDATTLRLWQPLPAEP